MINTFSPYFDNIIQCIMHDKAFTIAVIKIAANKIINESLINISISVIVRLNDLFIVAFGDVIPLFAYNLAIAGISNNRNTKLLIIF